MKKTATTIIFAVLLVLNLSCENKTRAQMIESRKTLPQFQWEENLNCPPGYPIEVYRGGLDGNVYVSLSNGTSTGIRGWGASGAGSSHGLKPLPSRINCIWVSYAEGCLYSIDSPIDYDKMLQLFQEGYQDSGPFFNGNGEYKKCTYNTIITGFAPGGVVVIWVMGGGRQVEIGRYQGEKYQVPEEEIARLDAHESLLFSKKEYKRIMNNTMIVPLEVREANAGKPIPFGLWDNYRVRYSWKPIFDLKHNEKIDEIYMGMYNGENEELFDKSLTDSKYFKRGIPKIANIGWKDKDGQNYGGNIIFDEKEIWNAFEELFKDNKEGQAELQFHINYTGTFITVQIKKGDKEIRLIKTQVSTFESTLE